MDELKIYLEESKQKRARSVKRANKVLKNTTRNKTNNSREDVKFPNITPKNFRKFEVEINETIQTIFYSSFLRTLNEEKTPKKQNKIKSSNTLIHKSNLLSNQSLSRSKIQNNPLMLDLKKRLHQKFLLRVASKSRVPTEKSPRAKKNLLK